MPTFLGNIITVTLNPTIDRVMEVPGFHLGGHLRGRMRSRTASGKAFNVSRALGALGVESTATGWMGRDGLELFERAARAAGVRTRFVTLDAPTRENITILDPQDRTETHIRDAGPMVGPADVERLAQELSFLAHPQAVIVFSGSTAPGMTAEQFGGLLGLCGQRGARAVIDTSLEALVVGARCGAWLLKPNLLELTELTGRPLVDDDAVLAAARELNQRIPIVVVTLGERGAYCLADGQAHYGRAAVPRERIRSTVGCGDAFMAGFLAEICSTTGTPESAFRKALAVAAASAMSDEPAVFSAADVELTNRCVQLVRV